MTSFIDSNIVVRYVMDYPPEQAEVATTILESGEDLILTEGVLAEISYVLRRNYNIPREAVVDALLALIRRANVQVHGLDKSLVIDALLLCRPSGRVSVQDALLWAIARSSGEDSRIYTFDERFPGQNIEIRAQP